MPKSTAKGEQKCHWDCTDAMGGEAGRNGKSTRHILRSKQRGRVVKRSARGCLGDGGADTRFPVCQQPRPRDTLPEPAETLQPAGQENSNRDTGTAKGEQNVPLGLYRCHGRRSRTWQGDCPSRPILRKPATVQTSGDSPIGFFHRFFNKEVSYIFISHSKCQRRVKHNRQAA